MKITLAAVSSVDGKLTRGDDPNILHWTSREDAEHFKDLKIKHNLIVMGRKTYEAMRSSLQLNPETLRVVLTSHAEDFAAETVNGQLEFTNELPATLVQRLENQGYSEMLLVGGGQVNAEFLAAGLVDEIYLSLEPLLFGKGTGFAAGPQLNVELELVNITRLNDRGTLLLHYKIEENKS